MAFTGPSVILSGWDVQKIQIPTLQVEQLVS